MHPRALVVVLALMLAGCFSTAPYDRAHQARVAVIDARFAAAGQLEQLRYARELAGLRAPIGTPLAVAPAATVSPDVDPTVWPSVLDVTLDAGELADQYRQRRAELERERAAAVRASLRQRDAAINDARTARRARVRAAADLAPLDFGAAPDAPVIAVRSR